MKRILVVDDEKDVETLFKQKFRKEIREGVFVFVFAFSGEEALLCMEQGIHEFMLILSDINMPGMSGLELLKVVKKRYETPPPMVMMITAYADAEKKDLAATLGADDFLNKPLDFIALKDKLLTMQA